MILQAYDFLQLNEACGCELQTGGSDQWGNITAGADLIRRVAGRKVYGLTFPLITKPDGTKFGKTESGTVWLDAGRTTPYQFYQFWINTDDQSVVTYLKYYTFLSQAEIVALAEEVQRQPEKREAQRVLARQVTGLVHGGDAARQAERISQALFYGDVRSLAEDEIEQGLGEVPTCVVTEPEVGLVDLLVRAGVCPSKRQAREDVQNGAIYLNGERCTEVDRAVRKGEGLHGKYVVIRRGRSRYFLVR
jgi:tyrosyl-tRNA synthetase